MSVLFNSHPHKEDDLQESGYLLEDILFNSHPHKEDDPCSGSRVRFRVFFNSHPHKEDDSSAITHLSFQSFSTHILTRRMTHTNAPTSGMHAFSTHILTRRMTVRHPSVKLIPFLFNSHPHKEDDERWGVKIGEKTFFNSHPHKEDDVKTVKGTKSNGVFNSHPHKEDDPCGVGYRLHLIFSTHILTRRMTAILNKNTLSKTARIIPFEYNTLKIYIFSNSYLLFFWKSTPFSSANLPEDFCALIIRTKISKYP